MFTTFDVKSLEMTIIIVVVIALIKVIGFLTSKLLEEKSMLTVRELKQLSEIHDLVTARDGDGMPLFYVPRSWANLQQSILDKMEKITRHQERTTYMMDTIVNTLNKISEREKR